MVKNLPDRKQLHDDQREIISRVIAQSMNDGEQATFILYDPVQDYEFTGVVMKIDQQIRRIKIQKGEKKALGCQWMIYFMLE